MSCLEATFTLTPKAPSYSDALGNTSYLWCYGADFWPFYPNDLLSLSASNRFFFVDYTAADPNLDYTQFANRKTAQHLQCAISLQSYAAANKQLALIFGFDVDRESGARVLVYSDGGLLQDQTLVYGDNQLLLEVDSLDLPINLYFIHAGGYWYFRGLSGYVV